jgi:hypothetical protein
LRQRFNLRGYGLASLVTLIAVAALATPAMAIPFEDPASGFKIDPPAPFFVQPATTKSYDFAAVVNSTTGAPAKGAGDSYLCQVGFKAQPDSGGLSQEEINLQVAAPGWLDGAATALSASFNVTGKATFMLEGATGIELVGQPKDAQAAGVFVSIIDTPKGRTTLNCATLPAGLDAALNQFRLIRGSITLPGTTESAR